MELLKQFMHALSERWGAEEAATYETLARRLGVTTTTVGNLMKGVPSKRNTVVKMADHAKIPRSLFLVCNGYLPFDSDTRWDIDRYGPGNALNVSLERIEGRTKGQTSAPLDYVLNRVPSLSGVVHPSQAQLRQVLNYLDSIGAMQEGGAPADKKIDYLHALINNVWEPVLILDRDLCVVAANPSFYHEFLLIEEEVTDQPLYEIAQGQWDCFQVRQLLETILPKTEECRNYEIDRYFPEVGRKRLLVNARRFRPTKSEEDLILLAIRGDIGGVAQDREPDYRGKEDLHTLDALYGLLIHPLEEDALPGFRIAVRYETAQETVATGRVFYDAFETPHNQIAFAVGEASGKASFVVHSIQVRNVLRALVREYPHAIISIMSRINDFIYDYGRFDFDEETPYFGLSMAILDGKSGRGHLVAAGSESPLIVRADGRIEMDSYEHNLPLGVNREEMFSVHPFRLNEGDALLMITNGLREEIVSSTDLTDEEWCELVKEALGRASVKDSAHQLIDQLKEVAGSRFTKDSCLLLARRAESS